MGEPGNMLPKEFSRECKAGSSQYTSAIITSPCSEEKSAMMDRLSKQAKRIKELENTVNDVDELNAKMDSGYRQALADAEVKIKDLEATVAAMREDLKECLLYLKKDSAYFVEKWDLGSSLRLGAGRDFEEAVLADMRAWPNANAVGVPIWNAAVEACVKTAFEWWHSKPENSSLEATDSRFLNHPKTYANDDGLAQELRKLKRGEKK